MSVLKRLLPQSKYHSYCPIQWGNTTSEQNCWLGDTNVTLPDVKTQDPGVVSAYSSWIKALVQEFQIDGLRIDGEYLPFHFHIGSISTSLTFIPRISG